MHVFACVCMYLGFCVACVAWFALFACFDIIVLHLVSELHGASGFHVLHVCIFHWGMWFELIVRVFLHVCDCVVCLACIQLLHYVANVFIFVGSCMGHKKMPHGTMCSHVVGWSAMCSINSN